MKELIMGPSAQHISNIIKKIGVVVVVWYLDLQLPMQSDPSPLTFESRSGNT